MNNRSSPVLRGSASYRSRRTSVAATKTAAATILALAGLAAPAHAEKLANPVAVFAGLDKITGRIISFDVYIDETVQFGALQVTPRVCFTRPPTEPLRITDCADEDGMTRACKVKRIVTGWMFAARPGVNAIELAVYDVWR